MNSFSVSSLTSLCTSIANRTSSSATELQALVDTINVAAVGALRAQRELLSNLSRDITQLERLLGRTTTISQNLQTALLTALSAGDVAVGKLHKQLMRVQPSNAHLIDESYLDTAAEFLVVNAKLYQFFTDVLSLTTIAEQDAQLALASSQQRLQHAQDACSAILTTGTILTYDSSLDKTSPADTLPLSPEEKPPSLHPGVDDEPPPYVAEAPTSFYDFSENGSSSSSSPGAFASLAKSFKAFASHFASKPDPFVSALCQAIKNGDTRQAGGLLAQGANIRGRNEAGYTPMHYAIMTDNEDALFLLLGAGATVKSSGRNEMPPLFEAAAAGKFRIAKRLLEKGADVNQSSISGQSYFVDVCGKESLAGVEFLLQHGAKASAQSLAGRPVLIQAVKKNNMNLVRLLLKYGAKATASDYTGSSALALATEKQDTEMATLLLDHGADVSSRTTVGTTVLADAVSKGRLDMVRLLLDRGAKGSDSDISGQSLILGVIKGNKFQGNEKVEVLQRLLQNGGNPNVKDIVWSTPAICHALEAATGTPSTSCAIVGLLLHHGADPNKYTMSNGETLLLYAMDKDKREEMRSLLHHGADPNVADKQGRTPLLQAAIRQDIEMIKLLRERGASLEKKGSVSAAEIGRVLDHRGIMEALGLEKGNCV